MNVVLGALERVTGPFGASAKAAPVSSERKRAFEAQEQRGLLLAFWARTIAVVLVSIFLLSVIPWPRSLYYLAWVAAFFLLGVIPNLLRTTPYWRYWMSFVFIALDVALITAVLLLPTGLSESEWPVQTRTRFPDFLYLLLYLAGSTLSFSPVTVLVTGGMIAAIWSVGYLNLYFLSDTVTFANAPDRFPTETFDSFLRIYLHPNFVSLTGYSTQVVITLIVTLVLATAIWRARRFMTRQIESELERESLSRFFSPDVVRKISGGQTLHTGGHAHNVAILFVDIVGFTGLSEKMGPNRTIDFLRAFHDRMASRVFAHNGTLDKYLGDGLMATFGTFESRQDDARRALQCALDMVDDIDVWNRERERSGHQPVRIAVGVHYGPVIAGDVGTGRRMEFTVVGDSVNVASRLERLSRDHETPVALSGDLVKAASVDDEQAAFGWRLEPRGNVTVRGRQQPLDLWVASGRDASTVSEG
ncbi:MAG: adenylate/guanylate cyclase domain-containing protein [Pseudomonadota bacterium]